MHYEIDFFAAFCQESVQRNMNRQFYLFSRFSQVTGILTYPMSLNAAISAVTNNFRKDVRLPGKNRMHRNSEMKFFFLVEIQQINFYSKQKRKKRLQTANIGFNSFFVEFFFITRLPTS